MKLLIFISFFMSKFVFSSEIETKLSEAGFVKMEKSAEYQIIAVDENGDPMLGQIKNGNDEQYSVIGLGQNLKEAQTNYRRFLNYKGSFCRIPLNQKKYSECSSKFAAIRYGDGGSDLNFVISPRIKLGYHIGDQFEDENPHGFTERLLLGSFLTDLVGLRLGLGVGDTFEAGVDVGTSVFVSNLGVYANVHPFSNAWSEAAQSLYVGGRAYKTLIFAVLAAATTHQYEGVVGYRFDANRGGFFMNIEAGINVMSAKYKNTNGGGSGEFDSQLITPMLGFGLGWRIGR